MSNEAQEGAGVWVAYYHDRSGVYVFASEIDALRYANESGGMVVGLVPFGHEIRDAQRPGGVS